MANEEHELNLMKQMTTAKRKGKTEAKIEHADRAIKANLGPTESEVIRLRFGLEDGVPLSEEEIAIKMDLDQVEIQAIIQTSLRKLRTPIAPNQTPGNDSEKS